MQTAIFMMRGQTQFTARTADALGPVTLRRRDSGLTPYSYLLNSRAALVPPKPNEFDSA